MRTSTSRRRDQYW